MEIPSPGAIFGGQVVANSEGAMAVGFTDGNGNPSGFLRSPSGKITLFEYPATFTTFFFVPNITAINSVGTILGSYFDSNGGVPGFLRTVDGKLTSFDAPWKKLKAALDNYQPACQPAKQIRKRCRPNPSPMSVNPVPVGGLAVFHIRLLPASGMPMSAVLQVNCALADAPRDRSADGIRLKLERSPAEFSEELGGSVMFLAMPPQPPTPITKSAPEPPIPRGTYSERCTRESNEVNRCDSDNLPSVRYPSLQSGA